MIDSLVSLYIETMPDVNLEMNRKSGLI